MTDSPTVVLVHGALTDASVWHPVARRLQDDGHAVVAPALPLRGLAGDVAYLAAFLGTVPGPTVLVGHSYGGTVISHPDAVNPAVRTLVFVAAFQPDAGETTGELNDRFPGSGLSPATTVVRPYPGGSELSLRPEAFRDVYAGDVDPELTAVLAVAQRPIDVGSLSEPLPGKATWHDLPSWAMVATKDRSLPVAAQRFMAERAGSTVVEVASSHAMPLAHPDTVAHLLRDVLR